LADEILMMKKSVML